MSNRGPPRSPGTGPTGSADMNFPGSFLDTAAPSALPLHLGPDVYLVISIASTLRLRRPQWRWTTAAMTVPVTVPRAPGTQARSRPPLFTSPRKELCLSDLVFMGLLLNSSATLVSFLCSFRFHYVRLSAFYTKRHECSRYSGA